MNVAPTGPTMKSLGVPLNEPGYNGDFYVAPDESYMFVSARETKTGECELYISFRKSNATWSVPVSLGSKINDGLADRWGQYGTPGKKYLFYSRGTSAKDCTLYWVASTSFRRNSGQSNFEHQWFGSLGQVVGINPPRTW